MRKVSIALICWVFVYACSSSLRSHSPQVADDKTAYSIKVATEGDENAVCRSSLISSIDKYLENTVPQVPDSLIHAVDIVLAKVEEDTATMNFLARHIFNKYLHLINSNSDSTIMGIENVIIHIIDNYYLSGKATTDDEKFINEIAEYANKNRTTLIGQQAKNLKMETISKGAESLYDIDSPYILLCFFDASCTHCRHEIPEIYKIFKKYKNKGLAGFCVYTRDDKKEWLEFISEYKLTDWINVWDPANENDFRIAYSLYYLPQVYVLDKDKKIIGHRLESASLSRLLNHIIKNKDNQ
jgi:peroxiredoxin